MLHGICDGAPGRDHQRRRAKVATRSSPPPTTAEIDHGVPMSWMNWSDELAPPHDRPIQETTRPRPATRE